MKRVSVPGQKVSDELARRFAPKETEHTLAGEAAVPIDTVPPVAPDLPPVTQDAVGDVANLPQRDDLAWEYLFPRRTRAERFRIFIDWLASVLFHLALILVLVFISVAQVGQKTFEVISQPGLSDELALIDVFGQGRNEPDDRDLPVQPVKIEKPDVQNPTPEIVSFFNDTAAANVSRPELVGSDPVPVGDLAGEMVKSLGNELSGRGQNKQLLVASGGGSEGSERAVALALAWLAEHQLPNGSWSFDCRRCPTCRGKCSHSGNIDAVYGATALGLLPFLGAGNTPYEGKYRKTVKKGIQFLLKNGEKTKKGISYMDAGSMYSHGLCTIVLCETLAMLPPHERSRWANLHRAAEEALEFIQFAQDPVEGGWRYRPRQKGDTSVVGWQLMALKSGQIGNMTVKRSVFKLAQNFLSRVVASDSGSTYGYTHAGTRSTNATNAIGLLCRLFLDWDIDNKNLLRGADRLLALGPVFSDPYYLYYATQLFHHIGGTRWQSWNRMTRDPLIALQATEGHEKGSWFPPDADGHCHTGGRLYVTALNCMTLEVYYRHLPLYQKDRTSSDFPLDEEKKDEESPENR